VPRSQVLGIKIQQNPLMRACGYARLGFVSRQSGEQIAANVIFPAVRTGFLRDGIRTHFAEYADAIDRPCRVGKRLAWGVVGVDTAVLALARVALAGLPSADRLAGGGRHPRALPWPAAALGRLPDLTQP
jgi:hypothetical protein